MRMPLVVMVVLSAALFALWALTDDGSSTAAAAKPASVPVIAERVEALRALRFTSVPKAVSVTPAQARKEGLEDLDRSYPVARQRADEELLKLLGLLEPDVSLRDLSASVFSQGVAGYYDPRTKRLRTVAGAATGTRVLTEMVLAHELTHALEDQRYGLDNLDSGGDDAALARLALVEGSATVLMYRYVQEHFTAEETIGGVLGSAFADTGSMPPFLQNQLLFPYSAGETFVQFLLRRAGGRWTLVDLADRTRPPASTEQVMHPQAYLRRGRAAARADPGEGGGRAGIPAVGGRDVGGALDARADGRGGRRRLGRGRRGLGRRPLRAVVARGRGRLPRALPGARRAGDALALGHRSRRA